MYQLSKNYVVWFYLENLFKQFEVKIKNNSNLFTSLNYIVNSSSGKRKTKQRYKVYNHVISPGRLRLPQTQDSFSTIRGDTVWLRYWCHCWWRRCWCFVRRLHVFRSMKFSFVWSSSLSSTLYSGVLKQQLNYKLKNNSTIAKSNINFKITKTETEKATTTTTTTATTSTIVITATTAKTTAVVHLFRVRHVNQRHHTSENDLAAEVK